ncbi:ABC transporter ATP-binding protein [Aristaeella hokkaidonensis]|uniref:ABC transporter ATP-binding protein n=1 Tax=Aristaeella hokkaidonensis TaxID=3046382 RepID=UPI000B7615A2|nr:ABC transporter ATP-binding protein [Aristaeella hokkaidonensis]SNT94621.1 ATP-binding cassette, subfamily B [Aristaeella hokkaidonensis]
MDKIQTQDHIQPRKGRGKLIWRFLKGSKAFFILSMICSAVASLSEMIVPQIIRVTVDNVIGGEPTDSLARPVQSLLERLGGTEALRERMWIMALAVLVVAGICALARYEFRVSNAKGSERLVKTMRDTLFSHIERLPFQWHMSNHTGDIIQRCTSDIETTRNFISEQMTNLMRIGILVVLSLSFMFSMNGKMALIAMIPLPVVIGYSLFFHRKFRKGFEDCDENEGKLSAMAQENLTGVRVVRAFGRERYERDRFEKHNEYYTSLWVKMGRLMSFFWSSSDILSGLQIMLVVVFGVIFCLKGNITSGEYIAFISYNGLLVWPVRQLGRMISEMSKAGVGIDRIGYIMDAEEEKDPEGALKPPMDGDICFDHVTFAYEGSKEMLHDVSLTIPSGTTLGILGGTGSGKSTLMYLLDRLYPLPEDCGKITIGGTDISKIALEHLRGNIGIVLQEPYLFSRTLRDNLGIAVRDLGDEELSAAVRAACLEETVQAFTKGYDTFVGERGVTLSGGQKQRAAIARMLTRPTPIMIFDDSLSAVDTETDAKIRGALEKRFGSATIILISHRITTLSKADQVLVLDHGKVSQLGTPAELSEQDGLYRRIMEIQGLSSDTETTEKKEVNAV